MASYYSKLELDRILAAQTTISADTNDDDDDRSQEIITIPSPTVLESTNVAPHDTNEVPIIETDIEGCHNTKVC